MSGRRAISPRRTRSGLLICSEDQEQGVPAVTTNQMQMPVVPRPLVVAALEGTVDIPPLIDLTQDVEVNDEVESDGGNGHQELLLHSEAVHQRIRALRTAGADHQTQPGRDPVTPQSRSPLDTTIDLTGSPDTPAPVSIQNVAAEPFWMETGEVIFSAQFHILA